MRVCPSLYLLLGLCSVLGLAACSQAPSSSVVTWEDILAQPVPPAGERIAYGSGPLQFGELRLPEGAGPHPVIVVLHGGCWRNAFSLAHIAPLSAALTQAGYATWTLEYRRLGDEGGGWPGTFQDVARGTDYLRTLAERFPLDLGRVVLLGHSAGGHLGLWLAGRSELERDSPLASGDPLPVRGVVSLAGITDLRSYAAGAGSCNAAVPELLGGTPAEVPGRYDQASPTALIPSGACYRLLHGALDDIVPVTQSRRFEEQSRAAGADARLHVLEEAGHFDLIAPFAPEWQAVRQAVQSLLTGE